jgi:hypothetical protein
VIHIVYRSITLNTWPTRKTMTEILLHVDISNT